MAPVPLDGGPHVPQPVWDACLQVGFTPQAPGRHHRVPQAGRSSASHSPQARPGPMPWGWEWPRLQGQGLGSGVGPRLLHGLPVLTGLELHRKGRGPPLLTLGTPVSTPSPLALDRLSRSQA